MFTDEIWARSEVKPGEIAVSQSTYVRLIAALTLFGAGFVALGAALSFSWGFSWPLMIGTFVFQIGSIVLFLMSRNPGVKLLGVNSMAFFSGMCIGPMVAQYVAVLPQAVSVTLGVIAIMSLAGISFPKVFEGLGPFIMAAVLVLIFGHFLQLGAIYVLGIADAQHMSLLTWAGVFIFSLSLAYEWSRALSLPYTVNNAIDASGAIILDGVNLFIRILQIMGGQSQNQSSSS